MCFKLNRTVLRHVQSNSVVVLDLVKIENPISLLIDKIENPKSLLILIAQPKGVFDK